MIKSISINIIPHSEQRYNTVGDWQLTPLPYGQGEEHLKDCEDLSISISDTGREDFNLLLAVHEFIEAILCRDAKISDREVDAFDLNWQPHRHWTGQELTEPGDDPGAPYYYHHMLASSIERMIAARMFVSWPQYEMQLEQISREGMRKLVQSYTVKKEETADTLYEGPKPSKNLVLPDDPNDITF